MTLTPAKRITVHPGVLLRGQLEEMGLSVCAVARAMGLPVTRLHGIVHERRDVSAETAIALSEFFEQTPEFWLNAQKVHELSKELVERGEAIRMQVRRRAKDMATV